MKNCNWSASDTESGNSRLKLKKMRQHQSELLTPKGQELVAIGVELEQKRQRERMKEQERRRQTDATLLQLQKWYKTALAINRPAEYLEQIVEITQEFRAGIPVPEIAHKAMNADLKQQQRQEKEIEQEKQRHRRDLDWSL